MVKREEFFLFFVEDEREVLKANITITSYKLQKRFNKKSKKKKTKNATGRNSTWGCLTHSTLFFVGIVGGDAAYKYYRIDQLHLITIPRENEEKKIKKSLKRNGIKREKEPRGTFRILKYPNHLEKKVLGYKKKLR